MPSKSDNPENREFNLYYRIRVIGFKQYGLEVRNTTELINQIEDMSRFNIYYSSIIMPDVMETGDACASKGFH